MPSNKLEECDPYFLFLLLGPVQQPSAINALHFHFEKENPNIDTPNRELLSP